MNEHWYLLLVPVLIFLLWKWSFKQAKIKNKKKK